MLVLANRHQNVLLLEQISLSSPALYTFVPMAHRVWALCSLILLLKVLWSFLKLCEKLGIKDVDLLVQGFG